MHCFIRLAAACGLMLAVGCATTSPPVIIPSAPSLAPRPISAAADAKPIQFRRIVVKMARGTTFGSLQGGYLCVPQGDLTWKRGQIIINDDELTDIFREELTKANYPVVGDPNALFEDASAWRAELLVAGLVTDMKANLCLGPGGSKGEVGMTVEWQVFSRLDRRIVHKVTTRGVGRVSEFSNAGHDEVFHLAFAQATRALLADEGFHRLVSGAPVGTGPEIREAKFRLSPRAPLSGPITARVAEVQAGVVTVFAGPAQGSGFFISGDGYVLTNAHVVREARFVKLKIATGREILGEVVATNTARDVALIKAQESGLVPLALRRADLSIGSDVYAIGSPFSERLASTVTRGIVSAFRVEDGARLIQSDVSIQPGNSGGPLTDASGNVVGVAMMGVAVRGAMAGLNFFIPIDEALRSIGIELGDAATGMSRMEVLEGPAVARAEPPAQAVAPATQVAAPPPPRATIDGEYRTRIPADLIAGAGPFDMHISVRSGLVTGYGQPSTVRGPMLCRASGSVASDGDALISITCSSGAWLPVYLRVTGRFEEEPGTTEMIGRTHYVIESGTSGSGELVWRR